MKQVRRICSSAAAVHPNAPATTPITNPRRMTARHASAVPASRAGRRRHGLRLARAAVPQGPALAALDGTLHALADELEQVGHRHDADVALALADDEAADRAAAQQVG